LCSVLCLLHCCCVGCIRATPSHTHVCSFVSSHLPPCFSAKSFGLDSEDIT
jgi:hypothetical protein